MRNGDVEWLQEMLEGDEASLRDHDEYGASLLFVSAIKLLKHNRLCVAISDFSFYGAVLDTTARDVQVPH